MTHFRLFAICLLLIFISLTSFGKEIRVKNVQELSEANKAAMPGDIIVLENGNWANAVLKLDCSGNATKPITFKAAKTGAVILSGQSKLQIGGNYLVVEGLLFQNGYAPQGAVIEFRISSKQLANNCRVTNCVINDFNAPLRMSENNWVLFYGKNNRLDHCSFFEKKNMGVLLAVILDDDRSRENGHSIDHNLFGHRPPLGSNGGEIIRVGVSEHCQFNSNTRITENHFDECDGETEIISIKSGANLVDKNVFTRCQGSVVLRHGDNNTVTNNLFLGHGKEGTGGVRVINKGQWVINNFFYECRGESFRSPLAIMNGIPNSPANRYVQVTDAVIMNNTFYNSAPLSFCEGSDAERTLPPSDVVFANNLFYNTADTLISKIYDNIKGIRFSDNKVNKRFDHMPSTGFKEGRIGLQKADFIGFPVTDGIASKSILDSLGRLQTKRVPLPSNRIGFTNLDQFKMLYGNQSAAGARWFQLPPLGHRTTVANCVDAAALYDVLTNNPRPVAITLTNSYYQFDKPLEISNTVTITSKEDRPITIATTGQLDELFVLTKKSHLVLNNLKLDLQNVKATNLIASNKEGSSEHYNLVITNSVFSNISATNIFKARKSAIADSVVIRNSSFMQFNNGFLFDEERDDKGYYNAEKILFSKNKFEKGNGQLLNIYRGGNDESTLGPDLIFFANVIEDVESTTKPAIELTGIQKTRLSNNSFLKTNASGILIRYIDRVRAVHTLIMNKYDQSGKVEKNQFVFDEDKR